MVLAQTGVTIVAIVTIVTIVAIVTVVAIGTIVIIVTVVTIVGEWLFDTFFCSLRFLWPPPSHIAQLDPVASARFVSQRGVPIGRCANTRVRVWQ